MKNTNITSKTQDIEKGKESFFDNWAYLRLKDDKINAIEYWNLETVIPVFIAPRLRALVKGMEGCGATPADFYDIDKNGNFIKDGYNSAMENTVELSDDGDDDSDWERWHTVLKKIQYAFDTLEANTYGVHSTLLDGLSDEQKHKVKEGLMLFAKNYFSLWY